MEAVGADKISWADHDGSGEQEPKTKTVVVQDITLNT
jgi:hypothetical protein